MWIVEVHRNNTEVSKQEFAGYDDAFAEQKRQLKILPHGYWVSIFGDFDFEDYNQIYSTKMS